MTGSRCIKSGLNWDTLIAQSRYKLLCISMEDFDFTENQVKDLRWMKIQATHRQFQCWLITIEQHFTLWKILFVKLHQQWFGRQWPSIVLCQNYSWTKEEWLRTFFKSIQNHQKVRSTQDLNFLPSSKDKKQNLPFLWMCMKVHCPLFSLILQAPVRYSLSLPVSLISIMNP